MLDATSGNCASDEALDTAYDKLMDIDCEGVRSAIAARRSGAEQKAAESMATVLHNSVHRCCVSRQQLVEFMRTPQQLAGPMSVETQSEADRASGMLLCDPLTRELKTRLYLARHVDCLSPVQPTTPPTDIFDAGVSP